MVPIGLIPGLFQPLPSPQSTRQMETVQLQIGDNQQNAATRHPLTPYRPKSTCTSLLQGVFISTNFGIIVVIFLAWIYFDGFIAQHTANNVYGPSTGLPCASRLLSWLQALFGFSLVTKFALFWILLSEFLDRHVIQPQGKTLECMIFTSQLLKLMIPFGFGFKLFWYFSFTAIPIR